VNAPTKGVGVQPPRVSGTRLPFLGNGLDIARLVGTGNTKDGILEFFLKCTQEHGPITQLTLGTKEGYFVNDADMVAEISKKTDIFATRLVLGAVSMIFLLKEDGYDKQTHGDDPIEGLVFTNGEKNKLFRTIGLQALSRGATKENLGNIVRKKAGLLRDRWMAADDAALMEGIRADLEAQRFTIDVIGEAAFSHDFKQLATDFKDQDKTADFVNDANAILLGVYAATTTDPLGLWRFFDTRAKSQVQEAFSRLKAFEENIIEKRRTQYNEGIEKSDFLGALLSARDERGNEFDTRVIRWCVHDMFLAGNDTTASTIAAALSLLAFHKDIQQALREEVTLVMKGEIPTEEDLKRMPLLEGVVNETLRLYPAGPFFSRECCKGPEVLKGYTFEKDSAVFMSPYIIQRTETYWTNPEKFDPSRFMPGGSYCTVGGSVPKFAWMPFGAGHRSCIGGSLALLEARTLLATVVQSFQFDLLPASAGPTGINHEDGTLDILYGITLTYPKGLAIRVKKLA